MSRQRASKPKVRSGCLTCKFVIPAGIKPNSPLNLPTGLVTLNVTRRSPCAPGMVLYSYILAVMIKSRHPGLACLIGLLSHRPKLESLQLIDIDASSAGESALMSSVLHLSLAEPTIRQAIAALGSLHEQATAAKLQPLRQNALTPGLPNKLYNKAIRYLIEKLTTDPHDIQLVAIVNVLFICFEYFQGNLEAAASHIRSGINLLNSWRQTSRKQLGRPWGKQYDSHEANFMETEIGPLLSLFNINSFQWDVDMGTTLLLNPVDAEGNVILPESFESIEEARVALLDLIASASLQFQQYDSPFNQQERSDTQLSIIKELVTYDRTQWNSKFDDLVRCKERTWTESEQRAADAVKIMSFGFDCQIGSYQQECFPMDWATNRSAYDLAVMTRLSNLSSDATRSTDDLSKAFSLDFGMAFPLHSVAWRSSWSHIDRHGLDLRSRIAQPELLETTKPYNSISYRMKELERLYLDSTPQAALEEGHPPPRQIRIHDFSVDGASQTDQGQSPLFSVTFWSKLDGPQGPWYCLTEDMQLGPTMLTENPAVS
ncbi:hypothetical protein N7481_006989 [Penicillium waksmanii]|uniref:uncharacterized protein n=1 Tax=Penicillium waksmanii TaxID=69791 RepID=UPI0025466288|nr:uncharacterized protein N7481_006989 [Penicillium waksmanii]KAJ5979691.1 hypothetical protein N7481_006989 [Penicillium waksmanii]